MPKPPTIRDVAHAAGLSVGAASMALRNLAGMSSITCQRVQEIAEKMGYVPKPLFATLGAKKFHEGKSMGNGRVAFLFSLPPGMEKLPVLFDSTRDRATKLGFDVDSFQLPIDETSHKLGMTLYAMGYNAVVLNPLHNVEHLPYFPWDLFSVVVMKRNYFPIPFSSVRYDPGEVLIRAWNEMRNMGCRRIGLALGKHQKFHPDDYVREALVARILLDVPAEERIEPLFLPFNKVGWDWHIYFDWVKLHRPDGIIGFTSQFLPPLQHQGYRIPKDFKFVCLHRMNELPDTPSGFTSIDCDLQIAALELSDQQIRYKLLGERVDPVSLLIQPRWKECNIN